MFPPQSHQRQHNKDKPYKCPNCYRAYSDSASLQIHLSAHAIKNAKAYSCSMCGRAYTSVSKGTPHLRCTGVSTRVNLRPSDCAGDLSHEAHVQTHGRGALSDPPVTSADRVPQHPHPHLPHLSPPTPHFNWLPGQIPSPAAGACEVLPLEPPTYTRLTRAFSKLAASIHPDEGPSVEEKKKIRAQRFFFSFFLFLFFMNVTAQPDVVRKDCVAKNVLRQDLISTLVSIV